jgi:hypothetical protein
MSETFSSLSGVGLHEHWLMFQGINNEKKIIIENKF